MLAASIQGVIDINANIAVIYLLPDLKKKCKKICFDIQGVEMKKENIFDNL